MPRPRTPRRWTHTDLDRLLALALANTPTLAISHTLGRTPAAVRKAASRFGIALVADSRPPTPRDAVTGKAPLAEPPRAC